MNRESLIEELNKALHEHAVAFRKAGIRIPTVRDRLKVKLSDYHQAEIWLKDFIAKFCKPFKKTLDIYDSFVTWEMLLHDDLSQRNPEVLQYRRQRKELKLAWRERSQVFRAGSIKKNGKGRDRKNHEDGQRSAK